jgi:hypothetical protein
MAQDIYSDNRKQVYDLLKEGGVNGLGSPEDFAATLDNDDNRRQVHGLLSELGVSGIGDYDTFSKTIYNGNTGSVNNEPAQDVVPELQGTTQAEVDDARGGVPVEEDVAPINNEELKVNNEEAFHPQLGLQEGGQMGGDVFARTMKEGSPISNEQAPTSEGTMGEDGKNVSTGLNNNAPEGPLKGDFMVGPWHPVSDTNNPESGAARSTSAEAIPNTPTFYKEGIVVGDELVTPLEEVKRYNRAHGIPEGSDAEEMQRYHSAVASENMRDYVGSLAKEALALIPEGTTDKQRENALNIVTRAAIGKHSNDSARLQQEASWLGVTPEEYWSQFILPNLRDAIGMSTPWSPMAVAEQLQDDRDAYNPYIDEYGRPMPTGRVNPMAMQRIERKKQREAIEADVMKTFDAQLQAGKEAAQGSAKDVIETDFGSQGAQGGIPNLAVLREANQLSAPENAINAAIRRLDELTKGMSQDQRALFGAQMYQQMQDKLVNERKANNTIEQIFKTAFLNSVTGKMTVGAVQTGYENYLDQLASKAYDPSFMTEVASEVGSFLFDFWTFLGPQAVGSIAAKGAVKSAVNKISRDLVSRGLGKAQAARVAERIASQSLKTKVRSHAVSGATTFGLHGFATSPYNTLTQPSGSESTRALDALSGAVHVEDTSTPSHVIGKMFSDLGWGAAGGALFGAGAIPEHLITTKFGNGLASSLAGKGSSVATNAAGMTGIGALEYYDESGEPLSWSELGKNYLKNVAMFATLDAPGFIAGRKAAAKNKGFRENYEITPSDVQKMRGLGMGDTLTDIAVKIAGPEGGLYRGEQPAEGVSASTPKEEDVLNGLYQLDELVETGQITEKEARKWYALLTGDYQRPLNVATAVRSVDHDGAVFVEWLDRDGNIVDREPMKSMAAAERRVKEESWQIQLNQIDALEKRLVGDDIAARWDAAALKDGWAAGMSEEYIQGLRDRESRGEALTDEERWVLRNNDAFRSGVAKMQRREALTKEEQQAVDATFRLLNKLAGESSLLSDLVTEFESERGIDAGGLKKVLEKRERSVDEQALVDDYVTYIQNQILGVEDLRPER